MTSGGRKDTRALLNECWCHRRPHPVETNPPARGIAYLPRHPLAVQHNHYTSRCCGCYQCSATAGRKVQEQVKQVRPRPLAALQSRGHRPGCHQLHQGALTAAGGGVGAVRLHLLPLARAEVACRAGSRRPRRRVLWCVCVCVRVRGAGPALEVSGRAAVGPAPQVLQPKDEGPALRAERCTMRCTAPGQEEVEGQVVHGVR